jgi:hypothetical protein
MRISKTIFHGERSIAYEVECPDTTAQDGRGLRNLVEALCDLENSGRVVGPPPLQMLVNTDAFARALFEAGRRVEMLRGASILIGEPGEPLWFE